MTTTTDERRVFDLSFESRDVGSDGKRILVGMAAPYNVETPIAGRYIEVFSPGVFKKSIKEAARALPLHVFHDHQSWPVGKAIAWEETSRGLIGTWEFVPEGVDEVADKAYRMAADGFIGGLSVTFLPIQSDVDPGSDTRPPRVTRREARMVETSMVTAPQYAEAQILLVRTAGLTVSRPHLEQWKQWRAGVDA